MRKNSAAQRRSRVARKGSKPVATRACGEKPVRLTDSELERLLLTIAGRAGLGLPETGVWLNGFKVDFYWPDLGLVVETDGLRYHRTAAQQERDRIRDQAHIAAGLTPLRFTHGQVRFESLHVEDTLRSVARRLKGSRGQDPTNPSIDGLAA